jgi:hypothetical protein
MVLSVAQNLKTLLSQRNQELAGIDAVSKLRRRW